MSRQPFVPAMVWRLNEAGVRGAWRLWRYVTPFSGPNGQLVQLPDRSWAFNDPWDHMARQSCRGGYERVERWACGRLIRPGGLVLDVGANHGIYTQLAAKLVGPTGRVIAFEPGPALPVLQSIIQRAGYRNVEVVPCAVGCEVGHTTMVVPGHQPALATLRHGAEQLDGRQVEVVRLDRCPAVPDQEIDLMKIDTEGYEGEVLQGAERLFDQGLVRAVLLEVSPTFGSINYLKRFIERYALSAYTLGYKRRLTYRPNLAPYQEANVRGQANILLTRKDVFLLPPA